MAYRANLDGQNEQTTFNLRKIPDLVWVIAVFIIIMAFSQKTISNNFSINKNNNFLYFLIITIVLVPVILTIFALFGTKNEPK